MSYIRKQFNIYHYLFFVGCYLVLQVAFSSGASLQQEFNLERGMHAVENRISLDLAHLSLPNPAMNVAGNPEQVREYLGKLNTVIAKESLPLRVSSLQQVTSADDMPRSAETIRQLAAPEQIISLGFAVEKPSLLSRLSGYPLLLAGLLLFFVRPYLKRKLVSTKSVALVAAPSQVDLLLDLEHKTIAINDSKARVELANKPLCFYLALLTYCKKNPDVRLCPHMQMPQELLQIADKYFFRLVDLGHTVRKRPDFNSNIEKMLSEIRCVLDELFESYPDQKAIYYPPKASGEGSRSKMHNFALCRLQTAEWDVKGK